MTTIADWGRRRTEGETHYVEGKYMYMHTISVLTDFLTTTESLSLVAGLSDLVGSLTYIWYRTHTSLI